MAITRFQVRGTAGAFAVIAILLGSQVPLDFLSISEELANFDSTGITVNKNVLYRGETALFRVNDRLLSDDLAIRITL